MISVSLFYCFEKVLILMNIWTIGKSSMNHHYLKKKDFYSQLNKEDITDDFEIKKRRKISGFACSKPYIIVR